MNWADQLAHGCHTFLAAKEVAVADGVFSRPWSLRHLGVEQEAKQLSLEVTVRYNEIPVGHFFRKKPRRFRKKTWEPNHFCCGILICFHIIICYSCFIACLRFAGV